MSRVHFVSDIHLAFVKNILFSKRPMKNIALIWFTKIRQLIERRWATARERTTKNYGPAVDVKIFPNVLYIRWRRNCFFFLVLNLFCYASFSMPSNYRYLKWCLFFLSASSGFFLFGIVFFLFLSVTRTSSCLVRICTNFSWVALEKIVYRCIGITVRH